MNELKSGNFLVGVLALQGAFHEHAVALGMCNARVRQVRRRRDLAGIDALVIPGGESTTIGKLMVSYHLLDEIRQRGAGGLPIFGTCAGLVMLAGEVVDGGQPLLGLMDITVRRNAFGRQVKSFEAPVSMPALGEDPFPGIFIRAPWIESAGAGVEVLAKHEGHAIAARQGVMLVSAFHPELTEDLRLHRFFLQIAVAGAGPGQAGRDGGQTDAAIGGADPAPGGAGPTAKGTD